MYRVSPALNRLAIALLTGALLATLWVNLSPASYYDFAEWRMLDLSMPGWLTVPDLLITPVSMIGEAAMSLFIVIIAKELWEAVVIERGALLGRQMLGPFALMAGATLGAVIVWVLLVMACGLQGEFDRGMGWNAPIGSDVVLCYLFGRMVFGARHPALKLVLLISIAELLCGLLFAGLFSATYSLRLLWLALPLAASLLVWSRYGHRVTAQESMRAAQRAGVVWPYVAAGLVSWVGVKAAGLPGALGLLPILPAVAHANRSFGLFAEAEGLLHDPLNRIAHVLVWPACAAMFGFGLTFGAIDLSAFGIVTVIMLAALWIGKPAGLLLTARLLQHTHRASPLMAITNRDLVCITPLFALAFTGPALGLSWTLPPGVMADAARLGLALSLLAGPVCLIIARKYP